MPRPALRPDDCVMRGSHDLMWLCTTCGWVAPVAVAAKSGRPAPPTRAPEPGPDGQASR